MTQTLTKAWGGPTTWGEALVLKLHHTKLGLNPYVRAIQAVMGKDIGSRTTFANLFDVVDPGRLDEIYRRRAWLLLTAMGEEPQDWGIGDDAAPKLVDVRRLRKALKDQVRHQGLEPRTRWFEVSGNYVVWPSELVA